MGTCREGSVGGVMGAGVTVTEAAIRTCGRLVVLMSGRIATHAYRDGGLICEDRTSRARPKLWRITPDGTLLSDHSYSFTRGAFARVALPQEATRLMSDGPRYPPVSASPPVISVVLSNRIGARHRETIGTEKRS